ncbi:hypothetical protein JCM8547_004808 [Rhodosporidiobolus lusitaniae]
MAILRYTAADDLSTSSASPKTSERPCQRCRQRRVRCDKILPVCGHCKKRGETSRCKWPEVVETKKGKKGKKGKKKGKEEEEETEEEEMDELENEDEAEDQDAEGEMEEIVEEEETAEEEKVEEGGRENPSAPSASTSGPSSATPPPTAPRLPSTLSSPVSPLQHRNPFCLPEEAAPVLAPAPPILPHPTFPRPRPTEEQTRLREAREALTAAGLYGADAPLDRVRLGDMVDMTSMFIDLLNVDASSSSTTPSPTPLLSLFCGPPPSPNPPPPATAEQAHASLGAYFRTIEPSLSLFSSEASKLHFQELCLEFWAGRDGSDGRQKEQKRGKGWTASYLACVATGALVLEEQEAGRRGIGLAEERVRWARERAEEAARNLASEGFPVLATTDSLRAALLLINFELGGLASVPDVPKVLSILPVLLNVAHQLQLHRDPSEKIGLSDGEREERRGLWWRVVELETAWSPLLGNRVSLLPYSFTTRLPSSSDGTAHGSTFHRTLLLSSKLTFHDNSAYRPSLLELRLLTSEYEDLAAELQAGRGANGEEKEDALEGILLSCFKVRLRAAMDEAGEEEADGEDWEGGTRALLDQVSNILRADGFQQLLALSTFLHAVVLVALRLRVSPSPSPTLSSALLTLPTTLKSSAWPFHLHRTLKRGLVVLEHLLPPSNSG